MAERVQQIFLRTKDLPLVESLLIAYVETHGNRFLQCSSVRLKGVAEVLTSLVKHRRKFRYVADSDWTVIWEIVHDTDFADPAVAWFVSEKSATEAIWIKLDYNYNIWAYQVFRDGKCVNEAFLPESYFSGDPESPERFRYGSCLEHADVFNSSRGLPLFQKSLLEVERDRRVATSIKKLTCTLPRTS